MSRDTVKSFERTEYSGDQLDFGQAYGVIRQILVDMEHDKPSTGMSVSMTGNVLRIHYLDYVQNLPVHIRTTTERSITAFREMRKHIIAEFKRRTGKTLDLREDPPEAKQLEKNYTVEKVSLNERYYYRAWRTYEVSFS